MATGTKTRPRTTMGPEQDCIVVERREIIATIPLSSNGSINPIVAAYGEIGQFFANNDEAMRLEFEYMGHRFEASHEPITTGVPLREGIDY